jgi:glutamate/tyrosine decarboxylase-like PLP-dependent enzyme
MTREALIGLTAAITPRITARGSAEKSPMSDTTLDPDDWEQFRQLGHRMIDDVVDNLRTVGDRPVWRPVPPDVKARLREPVPTHPQPAEDVYEEFLRDILPYPRGNGHPRFWGWVNGSGVPLAMMADLLASAMNVSAGAFENSTTMVEEQVVGWLKQLLGWDSAATGVLTSGCSMSNLIGLAVARHAKAGHDVRRDGMVQGPSMTLYGSREAHSSIQRAVELLGFGSEALRRVPVNADYQIDMAELRAAVHRDRRAGLQPICVIGNAGTVNSGAIDPLDELARFCADEGLWLHIDGAFGALAWLCKEARPKLAGMERADSLAFDLHKWMYLPYDIGCVFVRDGGLHHDTFSVSPAYLSTMPSGPASYPVSFADRGIELSRRFRALKVWFCLKAYGPAAFAEAIRRNIADAQYFARCIAASSDLELCGNSSMNVVCFRLLAPDLAPAEQDTLNRDVLVRIQNSGAAVPSHTKLNGRFVMRVAVTNHRSTEADFDFLIDEVRRIGSELRTEYTKVATSA